MNDLVWYVCYGSNLCYERFMCYITGNASVKYKVKKGKPCEDLSEPRDITTYDIPYELYFAKESPRWDNKGVAFLNTNRDDAAHTIGRAYLITRKQFEHVYKQEGGWYSNLVDLKPINGVPAITFTNHENCPYNAPCDDYKRVIKDGLMECGLSEEAAIKYIEGHIH